MHCNKLLALGIVISLISIDDVNVDNNIISLTDDGVTLLTYIVKQMNQLLTLEILQCDELPVLGVVKSLMSTDDVNVDGSLISLNGDDVTSLTYKVQKF